MANAAGVRWQPLGEIGSPFGPKQEKVGYFSAMASLQVRGFVADHDRLGDLDTHLANGPQQHPRRRFPASTDLPQKPNALLRMMRAVVGGIYAGARHSELAKHPFRQAPEVFFAVHTSCDTGLIGDNDDPKARGICELHQVKDPVDELNVVWAMHISVVDVDDAVTIQKKRGSHVEVYAKSRRARIRASGMPMSMK